MTTIHDRIRELDQSTRGVLEAYVLRVEKLDSILAALTRTYCANCPRNAEYGCCDFPDEAVREMPVAAVRLQEIECIENGGDLQETDGICRYHTPEGCSLRFTKSSSCLGQICGRLREELVRRYANQVEPFVAAMRKCVTGSLSRDPKSLFAAMDDAIVLGKGLLGSGTEHASAQDGESAGASSPPVT